MHIDPHSVYHSTARRSVLQHGDGDRRGTDRNKTVADVTTDNEIEDNEIEVSTCGIAEVGEPDMTQPDDSWRRTDKMTRIAVADGGETWQGDVSRGDVTGGEGNDEGWIVVERRKRRKNEDHRDDHS
jgi:hypothetical protein